MDDTNLDIVGQRSHEGTAKPVGRRQAGVRTAQRCRGLTPYALGTGGTLVGGREINCGHQLEAGTWAGQIGCLRTCVAFHVRLSETKENVEIGVDSGIGAGGSEQHGC